MYFYSPTISMISFDSFSVNNRNSAYSLFVWEMTW